MSLEEVQLEVEETDVLDLDQPKQPKRARLKNGAVLPPGSCGVKAPAGINEAENVVEADRICFCGTKPAVQNIHQKYIKGTTFPQVFHAFGCPGCVSCERSGARSIHSKSKAKLPWRKSVG